MMGRAPAQSTNDTIAKRLLDARKLIERGWTQKADARDAAGDDCDPLSDEADCYCLNGALFRARLTGALGVSAERVLETVIGVTDDERTKISALIDWNDAPGRTQAEVIAAFQRAEQIAREQVPV